MPKKRKKDVVLVRTSKRLSSDKCEEPLGYSFVHVKYQPGAAGEGGGGGWGGEVGLGLEGGMLYTVSFKKKSEENFNLRHPPPTFLRVPQPPLQPTTAPMMSWMSLTIFFVFSKKIYHPLMASLESPPT